MIYKIDCFSAAVFNTPTHIHTVADAIPNREASEKIKCRMANKLSVTEIMPSLRSCYFIKLLNWLFWVGKANITLNCIYFLTSQYLWCGHLRLNSLSLVTMLQFYMGLRWWIDSRKLNMHSWVKLYVRADLNFLTMTEQVHNIGTIPSISMSFKE